MKQYNWSEDDVCVIEDFITQEDADILINYMEFNFNNKYNCIDSSEKTRYIFPFLHIDDEVVKSLILKLYKKSWLQAVQYSAEKFNFKVLHNTFSRAPELVMWTGQGLSSHRDGHEKMFTSEDLESSGMPLSSLIYLNDNYDGGEIVFDDFNFKVKPKNLSFIIFPSFFAHSVNKITVIDNKNPRYTIPFFFGFYVEDFDELKNKELDFDLKNQNADGQLPLKG